MTVAPCGTSRGFSRLRDCPMAAAPVRVVPARNRGMAEPGVDRSRHRWAGMFALLCLFVTTASAGEVSGRDPSATSWAPWQTISFDQVNVDKGLPHATTTALAQDHDGLIWIGTVGGLVRYDGRSEEHTSELQSLMRSSYAV